MVEHRDGKVERFSDSTLLHRLHRHCTKLEVWPRDERMAGAELLKRLRTTDLFLSTAHIADEMMATLTKLHPIACLRFELEWCEPKNAADMLGIVWQFAERNGILQKQG